MGRDQIKIKPTERHSHIHFRKHPTAACCCAEFPDRCACAARRPQLVGDAPREKTYGTHQAEALGAWAIRRAGPSQQCCRGSRQPWNAPHAPRLLPWISQTPFKKGSKKDATAPRRPPGGGTPTRGSPGRRLPVGRTADAEPREWCQQGGCTLSRPSPRATRGARGWSARSSRRQRPTSSEGR